MNGSIIAFVTNFSIEDDKFIPSNIKITILINYISTSKTAEL